MTAPARRRRSPLALAAVAAVLATQTGAAVSPGSYFSATA